MNFAALQSRLDARFDAFMLFPAARDPDLGLGCMGTVS